VTTMRRFIWPSLATVGRWLARLCLRHLADYRADRAVACVAHVGVAGRRGVVGHLPPASHPSAIVSVARHDRRHRGRGGVADLVGVPLVPLHRGFDGLPVRFRAVGADLPYVRPTPYSGGLIRKTALPPSQREPPP
jgi:hypothetical protein